MGADSPARRNRGYDGPTPRGSHDDDGRWRALCALARRNATSTRAIRPRRTLPFGLDNAVASLARAIFPNAQTTWRDQWSSHATLEHSNRRPSCRTSLRYEASVA